MSTEFLLTTLVVCATPGIGVLYTLGAGLSQYTIRLDATGAGVGETEGEEWFFYVVAGKAKVNGVVLSEGGFAFVPPGSKYNVQGAAAFLFAAYIRAALTTIRWNSAKTVPRPRCGN